MTLIDDLEVRADLRHRESARLRQEAVALELRAGGLRATADAEDLEAVESMAAANLLRHMGFRVDRTEDGTARVAVDSTSEVPNLSADELIRVAGRGSPP